MNLLNVIILAYHLCIVYGNTESFMIYIPSDFPAMPSNDQKITHPTISLEGTNHRTQTFEVPVDSSYYIQLKELKVDEQYQIKICWTALNPIYIDSMDYTIVPHLTTFQETVDERNARLFIHFEVKGDSYPPLKGVSIPINVSVVNVKLGVPVDLYATLVYIILAVTGVYFINRHCNIYELLKDN